MGRVGADSTECGRAFQACAVAQGNARLSSVEQRVAGTISCDVATEHRVLYVCVCSGICYQWYIPRLSFATTIYKKVYLGLLNFWYQILLECLCDC